MTMNMNQYQTQAESTAIYPGKGSVSGLAYVGLGLGECGEVQGKIKKVLRDNGGVLGDAARIEIMKELGDVLWYVAMVASEIAVDLESIARQNLAKLADRAERGVLTGSGDNR